MANKNAGIVLMDKGEAARIHTASQTTTTAHQKWIDPKATFSDDDQSIDARMWRLGRDHREMGAR